MFGPVPASRKRELGSKYAHPKAPPKKGLGKIDNDGTKNLSPAEWARRNRNKNLKTNGHIHALTGKASTNKKPKVDVIKRNRIAVSSKPGTKGNLEQRTTERTPNRRHKVEQFSQRPGKEPVSEYYDRENKESSPKGRRPISNDGEDEQFLLESSVKLPSIYTPQQQTAMEERQRQMEEHMWREKRAENTKDQNSRELNVEEEYNPWGRPGCGAPASLPVGYGNGNQIHSQTDELVLERNIFHPPSPSQQQYLSYPARLSSEPLSPERERFEITKAHKNGTINFAGETGDDREEARLRREFAHREMLKRQFEDEKRMRAQKLEEEKLAELRDQERVQKEMEEIARKYQEEKEAEERKKQEQMARAKAIADSTEAARQAAAAARAELMRAKKGIPNDNVPVEVIPQNESLHTLTGTSGRKSETIGNHTTNTKQPMPMPPVIPRPPKATQKKTAGQRILSRIPRRVLSAEATPAKRDERESRNLNIAPGIDVSTLKSLMRDAFDSELQVIKDGMRNLSYKLEEGEVGHRPEKRVLDKLEIPENAQQQEQQVQQYQDGTYKKGLESSSESRNYDQADDDNANVLNELQNVKHILKQRRRQLEDEMEMGKLLLRASGQVFAANDMARYYARQNLSK
eukprot:m.5755 g.5755  ORF g.5755 m.5755 type:complete len:632 (-) comp3392_c0_seq1:2368-4263(-)